MNLHDAIRQLDSLPADAILFVEPVNGVFSPESRTVALVLSDAELASPVASVAALRAPGTQYFLEVSVAKEVIEGWHQNHANAPVNDLAVLERVIYYAVNDA